MNSKIIANGILRALGILLIVALILFFLYKIQSVIIYIVISIVLALVANPFLTFLRNKLKVPNTLAVIISMVFFSSIIFGVISMFIPLILQQGHNLSLLNTNDFQQNIKNLLTQINDFFVARQINLFEELQHMDLQSSLQTVPSLLNSFISALGSLSIGLFSILFITFFFMKDYKILHDAVVLLTPHDREERVLKSLHRIRDLLSRYFLGIILQITILFTVYAIILLIFNIESAIVIAFLCALLNIIPYVGPLIGGVLMLTLTMTSNLQYDFQTVILPTTLYVFIGYIIAQLIDNFFSQPFIFSKSVKSHPLEIFLIIIIGGLLFGIIGMILAVPAYTAIKVILNEFLADNEIVKRLTKDLN